MTLKSKTFSPSVLVEQLQRNKWQPIIVLESGLLGETVVAQFPNTDALQMLSVESRAK